MGCGISASKSQTPCSEFSTKADQIRDSSKEQRPLAANDFSLNNDPQKLPRISKSKSDTSALKSQSSMLSALSYKGLDLGMPENIERTWMSRAQSCGCIGEEAWILGELSFERPVKVQNLLEEDEDDVASKASIRSLEDGTKSVIFGRRSSDPRIIASAARLGSTSSVGSNFSYIFTEAQDEALQRASSKDTFGVSPRQLEELVATKSSHSFGDVEEEDPITSADSTLGVAMKASFLEAWTTFKAEGDVVLTSDRVEVDPSCEWQRNENVLIVIDWDDTLFPTSWLGSKRWFHEWIRNKDHTAENALKDANVVDREQLAALDLAACKFLEILCRLGQPKCVTLAKEPWVERSMEAFMPKLRELWKEKAVPIFYASAERVMTVKRNGHWCEHPCHTGSFESSILELQLQSDRKRQVIRRLMRHFYKKNGGSCLNVLSIGDGEPERRAMQEISFWHSNPIKANGRRERFRAKSIQLLDEPTCLKMTVQQKVLLAYIASIVAADQDMDTSFAEDLTLDP